MRAPGRDSQHAACQANDHQPVAKQRLMKRQKAPIAVRQALDRVQLRPTTPHNTPRQTKPPCQ